MDEMRTTVKQYPALIVAMVSENYLMNFLPIWIVALENTSQIQRKHRAGQISKIFQRHPLHVWRAFHFGEAGAVALAKTTQ
jgi:hypothetical protein